MRRKLAITFVLLAVLWLTLSTGAAWWLTARPFPQDAEEPAPTLAWGVVEPVRLTASDGVTLGAWFVDGASPTAPVVVVAHGYRSKRSWTIDVAERFGQRGCSVLAVSLRTHGDSDGTFNDFGFGARLDVVAAVNWLETRCPKRRIGLWGTSLGAAAHVYASDDLGERVSGLMLDCPYENLRIAVRNRTRLFLPPILDQAAYAGLTTAGPWFLGDVDRLSPVKAAAKIPKSLPVTLLAGGLDRRATPAEAEAIAAAIGENARCVVIADGTHSQLHVADPVGYDAEIAAWLTRVERH